MKAETAIHRRNPPAGGLPGSRPRLLAVCTVDVMAWLLLQPWLEAARDAGFEVELACADGQYIPKLRDAGYVVHTVPLKRSFNPIVNLVPFWKLYRVMARGKYDVVNTHSPVANVLGRLAARAAGVSCIISAVHGFYFHEHMFAPLRWMLIWLERIVGATTDGFAFVSDEDREIAIRLRIAGRGTPAQTIYNGVDLTRFHPPQPDGLERRDIRRRYNIPPDHVVVGIVARIVREKGYREFLSMASVVAREFSRVTFLVVGGTLESDRDRFDREVLRQVESLGLKHRFVFTGFTPEVPELLRAMDIFVLPSYREGFPSSVIEAMATGLPVVTTNIRGCREAVIHQETGILVRRADAADLTAAVLSLLHNPEAARQIGQAGYDRAITRFEADLVKQRIAAFFSAVYSDTARARA